eukprot:Nk52_evm5s285 gene=Nk52_evmTU5s285
MLGKSIRPNSGSEKESWRKGDDPGRRFSKTELPPLIASTYEQITLIKKEFFQKKEYLSTTEMQSGESFLKRLNLESVFKELQIKYGFQKDNVENQCEHYNQLVRGRMSNGCGYAVKSIYDELVGERSNYCQWADLVVGEQIVLYEEHGCRVKPFGFPYPLLTPGKLKKAPKFERRKPSSYPKIDEDEFSDAAKMVFCSALYLCIWGEAANLRFAPELLCFLYKMAIDFSASSFGNVPEKFYLNRVIKPLYNFVFKQSHFMKGDKAYLTAKDHSEKIIYDDMNELFWSLSSMRRILTVKGESLMEIEPSARYMALEDVNWDDCFEKTYVEHRTAWHLLVNHIRVWVLYLSTFIMAVGLSIDPWRPLCVGVGLMCGMLLLTLSQVVELFFIRDYRPHYIRLGVYLSTDAVLITLFALCEIYREGLIELVFCGSASVALLIFIFMPREMWPYEMRPIFLGNWVKQPRMHDFAASAFWFILGIFKFAVSLSIMEYTFYVPYSRIINLSLTICGTDMFCTIFKYTIVMLLLTMNFVLYLVDANMWYVVFLGIVGYIRGYYLGLGNKSSVFSQMKSIVDGMFSKIIAPSVSSGVKDKKSIIAPLWNEFIEDMWKDYLISEDEKKDLKYVGVPNYRSREEPVFLDPPAFTAKKEALCENKEAQRRLKFFTRSMSMRMPESCTVDDMRSFTCFTPHYNETIMYSKEDILSPKTGPTENLIDYLSNMFKDEWEEFSEREGIDSKDAGSMDNEEKVMKVRRWASLRAQTLYRTVRGMMTYERALKLLVETENRNQLKQLYPDKAVRRQKVDELIRSKFNYLIAMQRYYDFTKRELQDAEILLTEWPNLNIVYLEKSPLPDGNSGYYVCLIDGHCELLDNGRRKPRYRIELPGFPILGDGKSDNQNQGVVYARGEVLQVIDANQDHYIEECFKLRNVLKEFENDALDQNEHIAIVGAREHVFSNEMGALASNSAGKELVFGTLVQRVMTVPLHVRYHYGHPDYMNKLFCITRGGVSKGTKGLHVNEDIYCGLTSVSRKGDIKHVEYCQSGKGRDMGFQQILGFTKKIARGAGEQSLSRDHYRMGTYMPLSTHLSFYFTSMGFHINPVLLFTSIYLYLFTCYMTAAFAYTYQKDAVHAQFEEISESFNGLGVYAVTVCLIHFVMMIAVLFQVTLEHGFLAALKSLVKQVISLSPIFEVFCAQLNSVELLSDLRGGQASYISTGRGFAVNRVRFATLYNAYSHTNIRAGFCLGILLAFIMSHMSILGESFFWMVIISTIYAPFIFNTRQFVFSESVVDLLMWIKCLYSGHTKNSKDYQSSWIEETRNNRISRVGQLAHSKSAYKAIPSSFSAWSIIDGQIPSSVLRTGLAFLVCYPQFAKISVYEPLCGYFQYDNVLTMFQLLFISPLMNTTLLTAIIPLSLLIGKRFASTLSIFTYSFGIFTMCTQLYWIFEYVTQDFYELIAIAIFKISLFDTIESILMCVIGEEYNNDDISFWSGNWFKEDKAVAKSGPSRSVGKRILRELICKNMEMIDFGTDVVCSICVLIPLLIFSLVPFVDRLQTALLFFSFQLAVKTDESRDDDRRNSTDSDMSSSAT